MKKWMGVFTVFCMMGLSLTACSSNEQVQLPALTAEETAEAKVGAHSWTVKQGFGSGMTQETSAVFPLDHPDDYPPVSLPQNGMIRLAWQTPPDTYDVQYWKESVWEDGMDAIAADAQENGQRFEMLEADTPAIVTVHAQWEKSLFRSEYGDIEYIFKVVSEN